VRVKLKTTGIAAATQPLHYETHAVWMTNWRFYLNSVRPSVSTVTSLTETCKYF